MKKIYFKRKTYGWGWTPVTWQGWAITLGYIAILVILGTSVNWENTREAMMIFFLPLAILTIAFIRIAYATGKNPRWQWGNDNKRDDKKD